MSYVVSIVRDTPIGEAELRAIAQEISAFQFEDSDGFLILEWAETPTSRSQRFVLSDGSLDITSPTDAALKAAQSLAGQLGAQVVGEEGEDLTKGDVAVAPEVSPGCGPFAWSVALIVVLVTVYWLFN